MPMASELMNRDVVSVGPDVTVKHILQLWQRTGFGAFPVVRDAKVVGIVTEGDLVRMETPIKAPAVFTFLDAVIVIGGGKRLEEDLRKHVGYLAKDMMSSPVVTVGPATDVSEAARLLVDHKIKHLPVIDAAGRLIGMLSRKDLLRHLAETLAKEQ